MKRLFGVFRKWDLRAAGPFTRESDAKHQNGKGRRDYFGTDALSERSGSPRLGPVGL
jgi:hypothetical protein